jgi:hypothetical protein
MGNLWFSPSICVMHAANWQTPSREGDHILFFTLEGGINIGDVHAKARTIAPSAIAPTHPVLP